MPDDAMEEIETEFLLPPPRDSQRERRESASSLQPEMGKVPNKLSHVVIDMYLMYLPRLATFIYSI